MKPVRTGKMDPPPATRVHADITVGTSGRASMPPDAPVQVGALTPPSTLADLIDWQLETVRFRNGARFQLGLDGELSLHGSKRSGLTRDEMARFWFSDGFRLQGVVADGTHVRRAEGLPEELTQLPDFLRASDGRPIVPVHPVLVERGMYEGAELVDIGVGSGWSSARTFLARDDDGRVLGLIKMDLPMEHDTAARLLDDRKITSGVKTTEAIWAAIESDPLLKKYVGFVPEALGTSLYDGAGALVRPWSPLPEVRSGRTIFVHNYSMGGVDYRQPEEERETLLALVTRDLGDLPQGLYLNLFEYPLLVAFWRLLSEHGILLGVPHDQNIGVELTESLQPTGRTVLLGAKPTFAPNAQEGGDLSDSGGEGSELPPFEDRLHYGLLQLARAIGSLRRGYANGKPSRLDGIDEKSIEMQRRLIPERFRTEANFV